MATTAVEIANSALVKIGTGRIISLEDANERARLCNEQYNKVRKELLYSHPWNFAIARVALTLSLDAPLFDWASKFALPADCLRVVGTDLPDGAEWHVEGAFFMCNYAEVNIKYIKNIENVTLFNPAFEEALAAKLAAEICYSIVQSVTLKDKLENTAEIKLKLARSFDAQESVGDRVYADGWLNSRA